LCFRKLRKNRDQQSDLIQATEWARERSGSIENALVKIGLFSYGEKLEGMPIALLLEGEKRASQSKVKMGGPGDLNLLYAIIKYSEAKFIIETGVAYGWSSLAILAGIENKQGVKLISVDMAYPKANNEAFVGIVVPEYLKSPWKIIHQPDRYGIKRAIKELGEKIDVCHYDSDKSWYGRQYGYELLWSSLRTGGILISDDIEDNMAFADFVKRKKAINAVTMCDGKYIGILIKS
jgi:predicted O-methyltransferase YrrM